MQARAPRRPAMPPFASLVDPDRITRASEKTARRSGVNPTLFASEAEALAWLLG